MLLLLQSLFALIAVAEVVTIPIHANLDGVKERLARRGLGGSRSYQDILRDRAGVARSYQITSNENLEQNQHRVEITVGC
jgi:hypothetical protein